VCVSVVRMYMDYSTHPSVCDNELRGKITTKVNLYYNWAVGVPAKWGNGVARQMGKYPM